MGKKKKRRKAIPAPPQSGGKGGKSKQQVKARNLLAQGDLQGAQALYREIMEKRPKNPEALSHMGMILQKQGRAQEALGYLEKAIKAGGGDAIQYTNLGIVQNSLGRTEEAIESYRQALKHDPKDLHALNNLGGLCASRRDYEAAVEQFRQADTVQPNHPVILNNLGSALRGLGEMENALQRYRQAIALQPRYAEAYANAGSVLVGLGHLKEGLQSLRQAIAIKPDYADAHFFLALGLLLTGDYADGFAEYEWRVKCPGFNYPLEPDAVKEADELSGKTVHVLTEQGYGDAIMMARYLPELQRRGARVHLHCQAELLRLFTTLEGIHVSTEPYQQIRRSAEEPILLIMSLPHIFGTTPETIPTPQTYLRADPLAASAWPARLAPEKLKVGLAWAGRPTHQNDRNRSIPLEAFAPLAEVEGVEFVSLQKSEHAAATAAPPPGMMLHDWTAELGDFADTAALIEQLDLVISVDTAAAHLAGAMGKPAWVLLPHVPDWRWGLGGETAPWYPHLRLFRQPAPGDWASVTTWLSRGLAELKPASP